MLLIIAIAIKLDSKGPVIVKLNRIGKNCDEFNIFKFRTLDYNNSVTRVGYYLRRLSLDELPQFFNVLRGEMSIVGPRPANKYELNNYKDLVREKVKCKPGITGLSQIYIGKYSYDKKLMIDIEYCKNNSLVLDFMIILRTLNRVLS
jgi:lipopolysaccharide/colanic/teichoic acid biosynthesis glycosyltransferase